MTVDAIKSLLAFLNDSPTSFHAAAASKQLLHASGFENLNLTNSWSLKPGGKYVVTHNDTALYAFILPRKKALRAKIVGSHLDSPSFKLKPHSEYQKENMVMVGLEVYGAPLISSWLNRDLGIAGRLFYLNKNKDVQKSLVKLNKCPVTIPQLAIHLDRQVNEKGLLLNEQEQLAALAGFYEKGEEGKFLIRQIQKAVPEAEELLSSDLFLYPIEEARLIGNEQELISSYRLDNLCSLHASLEAFKGQEPQEEQLSLLASWDHEEIGSNTPYGAASPLLSQILERITLALQMSREELLCMLQRSLSLSVDLAHAQHPNYQDRHEPRHPILMKKGIVVKWNAQQRYATDGYSSSFILELCKNNNIPHQAFVTRGGMACGSTIGPIHASQTGIATIDIGIGQLSMHSARELVASTDYLYLHQLLTLFYQTKT